MIPPIIGGVEVTWLVSLENERHFSAFREKKNEASLLYSQIVSLLI